jgi:hypothetical protein
MTKTIAIALAITASLVGSESFAGQPRPLLPGQSVTLKHRITIQPGERVDLGEVFLKRGDRYYLEAKDVGEISMLPAGSPIDRRFRGYSLKLEVFRYWYGKRRFNAHNSGNINPQPGKFSTVGLPFTAIDGKMSGDRWYEFSVTNTGGNPATLKIRLVNAQPVAFGVDNVEETDELDALEQELVDELDEE